MDQRSITCCFTGHRPVKLPWGLRESDERCVKMKSWITSQIEDLYSLGYRRFMCGMAIGCDMIFAEAVIDLKNRYDDVSLFAAIPCRDQMRNWNKSQKQRYADILDSCDASKVFSETYNSLCMNERNLYMVENSSALIACYSGYPGGTMNTILYAERQDLDIRIFDISEL